MSEGKDLKISYFLKNLDITFLYQFFSSTCRRYNKVERYFELWNFFQEMFANYPRVKL